VEIRPKDYLDNSENRLSWFEESLQKLRVDIKKKYKIEKTQLKLYFPYKIGCGLAGGDWNEYSKVLEKFSSQGKHYYEVFIVNNN
jgi:hypothetical protein